MAENRKKEAENNLTTLQKTTSDYEKLYELSAKNNWTSSDIKEMTTSLDNIMDSLKGDDNKNLRELILHNLKELLVGVNTTGMTLSDILYTDKTGLSKEEIYYKLMLAKEQAENKQNYDLLETDYREIYNEAKQAMASDFLNLFNVDVYNQTVEDINRANRTVINGVPGDYWAYEEGSNQKGKKITDERHDELNHLKEQSYSTITKERYEAIAESILKNGTIEDRMATIEKVLRDGF